MTIFHEYGALSHARFARVGAPLLFGKSRKLVGHEREYAVHTISTFYERDNLKEKRQIPVYQQSSVTVHGTQYKLGVNNFLVIDLDDAGLPEFGKLSKVWFVPYNKPFFVVMAMNTDCFCQTFHAFEISDPQTAQGYDVISHSDLPHFRVYHAHKKGDEQYITCKESILCI